MILQSSDSSNSVVSPDPSPCRLLYVVGQLGIGGLERQLYYLLLTLDQLSYRPAVVVWNLKTDEKYYREIAARKVPIYGFPADCSPVRKLQRLRAIVLKAAPEVIHSYGFHTNFAAYYAARGTNAVPIGSLRCDFAAIKKAGGPFRGALNARWPVCHISNSSAGVAAARRDNSFFTPRHYSVVRNGLDLDCFRVADDTSKTRAYVAGVGSLLPVKRWDRVLCLAHTLKQAGMPDIRFRIAGDGPLRSSLEQQVRDLGLCANVEFIGATHDVPAFLAGARFLVHTSESEGCPNAVMEAMASGIPVVAMEAGDIACLVEDGRTGFVVPQKDEEALAERSRLLWADPARCRRMGQIARAKAELDFGLDRLVTQTLDVYRAAGWMGT